MVFPKSSSGKRSATRGSLDCRVKPDNDNYLFVIPRFSSFPRHIQAFFPLVIPVLPPSKSSPGILPLSHPRASVARPGDLLDCRVKPEYDGKKNKPDNGRKRRKSCSGLTRASKKHKAEPHDMYIESSALQRRFMPQPLMRSSWQQLVNPFFCRHILQRDNQLLVQSVTDVEQTA